MKRHQKKRLKKQERRPPRDLWLHPLLPSVNGARVKKFQMKVAASPGCVAPEASSHFGFSLISQLPDVPSSPGMARKKPPPVEWGWFATPNGLQPVKMVQPAAPEPLLRTIRCHCSGRFDKRTCTCSKHGLQCTRAKGIICLNVPLITDDEDTEYSRYAVCLTAK